MAVLIRGSDGENLKDKWQLILGELVARSIRMGFKIGAELKDSETLEVSFIPYIPAEQLNKFFDAADYHLAFTEDIEPDNAIGPYGRELNRQFEYLESLSPEKRSKHQRGILKSINAPEDVYVARSIFGVKDDKYIIPTTLLSQSHNSYVVMQNRAYFLRDEISHVSLSNNKNKLCTLSAALKPDAEKRLSDLIRENPRKRLLFFYNGVAISFPLQVQKAKVLISLPIPNNHEVCDRIFIATQVQPLPFYLKVVQVFDAE